MIDNETLTCVKRIGALDFDEEKKKQIFTKTASLERDQHLLPCHDQQKLSSAPSEEEEEEKEEKRRGIR